MRLMAKLGHVCNRELVEPMLNPGCQIHDFISCAHVPERWMPVFREGGTQPRGAECGELTELPMHHASRRRTFRLGFAAMTFMAAVSAFSAPTHAANLFDGYWNVSIKTQAGGCDPSYSFAVEIADIDYFVADGDAGSIEFAGHVEGRVADVEQGLVRELAGAPQDAEAVFAHP